MPLDLWMLGLLLVLTVASYLYVAGLDELTQLEAYIAAGIVALVITVYLFAALLYPERF